MESNFLPAVYPWLTLGAEAATLFSLMRKISQAVTIHEVTLQILGILREGPNSANHIVLRLSQENDGKTPPLATLYRHLKTALDNGWIAIAGEAQAGLGRPQQRYRVTDAGAKAAAVEARRLRSLADLALGKTQAV